MKTQDRFTLVNIPVDTAVQINALGLGGFLAKTAGTFTLSRFNEITGANDVLITAQPVAVGWNIIPFFLGSNGGTFTTAGGASGALAVT